MSISKQHFACEQIQQTGLNKSHWLIQGVEKSKPGQASGRVRWVQGICLSSDSVIFCVSFIFPEDSRILRKIRNSPIFTFNHVCYLNKRRLLTANDCTSVSGISPVSFPKWIAETKRSECRVARSEPCSLPPEARTDRGGERALLEETRETVTEERYGF